MYLPLGKPETPRISASARPWLPCPIVLPRFLPGGPVQVSPPPGGWWWRGGYRRDVLWGSEDSCSPCSTRSAMSAPVSTTHRERKRTKKPRKVRRGGGGRGRKKGEPPPCLFVPVTGELCTSRCFFAKRRFLVRVTGLQPSKSHAGFAARTARPAIQEKTPSRHRGVLSRFPLTSAPRFRRAHEVNRPQSTRQHLVHLHVQLGRPLDHGDRIRMAPNKKYACHIFRNSILGSARNSCFAQAESAAPRGKGMPLPKIQRRRGRKSGKSGVGSQSQRVHVT